MENWYFQQIKIDFVKTFQLVESKNEYIVFIMAECYQRLYVHQLWSFVNLGIGTSTLELELELKLELILQTPLVPQGLWTPNLAGWWLRMRGAHLQSHVTLRYRGHVTNKKRYISTFTRAMDPKLSMVVT